MKKKSEFTIITEFRKYYIKSKQTWDNKILFESILWKYSNRGINKLQVIKISQKAGDWIDTIDEKMAYYKIIELNSNEELDDEEKHQIKVIAILLWTQRDVTLSHFLVKSILRFSPLLLLLRFWEKHKRIKRKMLYRKRFRRSENLKRIQRKTQNT